VSDPFVDPALASRFERFEAWAAREMVRLRAREHPGSGAEAIDVAGAVCSWFAPESDLNHVFALGLEKTTGRDLDAIETFYRDRGDQKVRVELSPYARREVLARLAERGYGATGFEQVLVRPLDRPVDAPANDRVEVRAIDVEDPADVALWIRLAGEGFHAPGFVPRSLEGVFEVTHRIPGTTPLLALVDGEPAAVAAVAVKDDLAALFGGATLERHRGMGAHSALLKARIALALEAGARWATAGSAPGSQSQHNMERHGFRVAYTRPVRVRAL
jgi:hypothetical protein